MENRKPSPQSSPGWSFWPASTEAISRAENSSLLPNRLVPIPICTRGAYSSGTVSFSPPLTYSLPPSNSGSSMSSSSTSSVSISGTGSAGSGSGSAGSAAGSGVVSTDSGSGSAEAGSIFAVQAVRSASSRARARHRIRFRYFMVLSSFRVFLPIHYTRTALLSSPFPRPGPKKALVELRSMLYNGINRRVLKRSREE